MWKILRELRHSKRVQYEVQCDCGAIEMRRKDHVRSGRTVSCRKCSAIQTRKDYLNPIFTGRPHEGIGSITKTFWRTIQNGAKVRGIPFDITIEYAWELFESQKRRCALSGVPIWLSTKFKKCNPDYSDFNASLDRIDSTKGYIEGNVQWIHKDVNFMKSDMTDPEFLSWCQIISSYQTLKISEKLNQELTRARFERDAARAAAIEGESCGS